MAFDAANLVRIGGGSGRALWYYTTTEAQAAVQVEDYFLPAINMINTNDVIICVTATGGTPVISHAYCNENDGTTIDIVDGVAITNTDSD